MPLINIKVSASSSPALTAKISTQVSDLTSRILGKKAGLIATINFSGNCLPEENVTAVIYDLRFARDRDGKPGGEVPPSKVPPVLLAECWHDYHVAASKGAFDPEWERRSPW